MLLDDSNTVLAYGKIGSDTSTGEKIITIPTGVSNATKLYVFAEQASQTSGSTITDYASNMVDVSTKAPTPSPTPIPSDDNDKDKDKDADNENTQSSNSKNSGNTYVNPLKWKYPQNQPESLVLPEQQGPVCVAAFKLATPKGYKEALSLNLLLHNKAGYDSKQKTLTIYIPDAYLKSGRTFALIGIDQYGKTHYFTDTDLKADSITINIEGFEGYAFDLIYKD